MLYHVTIGDRTVAVDLSENGITVDGVAVSDAQLMTVTSTGVHHLLAEGQSHALLAHPSRNGVWEMHIAGRRLSAEVVDERTRAIRAMTRTASGPTGPRPVKAPMPGLVTRIEVAVGDTVRAGQAVEKGTVLVEFAPLEQS
jgi:pyruvate carboxylase subunit B